jgi:DDE superfamily endonuclease
LTADTAEGDAATGACVGCAGGAGGLVGDEGAAELQPAMTSMAATRSLEVCVTVQPPREWRHSTQANMHPLYISASIPRLRSKTASTRRTRSHQLTVVIRIGLGWPAHRPTPPRLRRAQPGDKWHLDEVLLKIAGKRHWLWRAIDQTGSCWTSSFRSAGISSRPTASSALYATTSVHADTDLPPPPTDRPAPTGRPFGRMSPWAESAADVGLSEDIRAHCVSRRCRAAQLDNAAKDAAAQRLTVARGGRQSPGWCR